MERNRYADLLRVGAITVVVYGHWLLTSIIYSGGRVSGQDALNYIHWGEWVTWGCQVMPVFFLVGGYVNAGSWSRHEAAGESWVEWARARVMGLLWPSAVYIIAGIAAFAAAGLAGVPRIELEQAGWLVALQLWFLPVYLLLIALTPAAVAAHRRWGLAVPAAMAAGAGLVDVCSVGLRMPVVGFANYVLVWGSMHQWGFSWRDGTLTARRWRPWALAAGGAVALGLLTSAGPFPVDMIGAGEKVGNTTPPSVALLAYAAVEAGLVLAAEPLVSRWLRRPSRWNRVRRLNGYVMTVYLWHMVPAVIIAVTFYPTGIMPVARPGSALWWETRPAWWALLTAVLVPLVLGVLWAERPMRRLPAGMGSPGQRSPALLVAGVAVAMVGLARLAIGGFSPGGRPPLWALLACLAGLAITLASGRADSVQLSPSP